MKITQKMIKEIKKLHSRKYREEMQLFLVEGERLVAEAANIEYCVCRGGYYPPQMAKNTPIYTATEKEFALISTTQSPQGILAVCQIPQMGHFVDNGDENSLILLLDQIADPGNLGTILRTAECAGISAVILSENCVDLYNPKVVRSTMGAIFRLPIFTEIDLVEFIKNSPERKFISMSLSEKSENFYNLDISGKVSIIIGNEANGISAEVLNSSDYQAIIPMNAGESLNASIAAGIVAFEWRRQNFV